MTNIDGSWSLRELILELARVENEIRLARTFVHDGAGTHRDGSDGDGSDGAGISHELIELAAREQQISAELRRRGSNGA